MYTSLQEIKDDRMSTTENELYRLIYHYEDIEGIDLRRELLEWVIVEHDRWESEINAEILDTQALLELMEDNITLTQNLTLLEVRKIVCNEHFDNFLHV